MVQGVSGMMPRYRLSIEIETDQDPSALMEVLCQFGEGDLLDNCYPEQARIIDGSEKVVNLARVPGELK